MTIRKRVLVPAGPDWVPIFASDENPPGVDIRGLRATRMCIRKPKEYWGNVNPTRVGSCYDEGKRCAETLFFDYQQQHSLEFKLSETSTLLGRVCTPMMDEW
jgi:hypothetical protein